MRDKERLKTLLKELFQFDKADLDFGIYRIMNQKREEIENFIENDLINYIKKELSEIEQHSKNDLEQELEEIKEKAKDLGVDYKETDGYKKVKNKMENYKRNKNLESNVYNEIYRFFKRYYDKGDFLSKRRYSKKGKYAIPYNGEEVYLHWANNDQYYIKTSEEFSNYSFKQNGITVNFRVKQAQTTKNNNKEDEDRYFILRKKDFFEYNSNKKEVNINFEYRPLTSSEEDKYNTRNNQRDIRQKNYKKLKKKIQKDTDHLFDLNWLIDDSKKAKTTLESHLYKYTTKNKSDYFIHKDLKGFLERELDFFIKNEIIDVDAIATEEEKDVNSYLTKVKVIKSVSKKIIEFLAQIENFQKKFFEKKKFVLDSEYCLTLDKVPEEIREEVFEEVLKNEDQLDEWEELYDEEIEDINDIYINQGNLFDDESLKDLVIDTKYFPEEFKEKILSYTDKINDKVDGLMIKSENYQALNFLDRKYNNKIKCIYIDPPYNTGNNEFVYKDNYKHSSWLSMMKDRLKLSRNLLTSEGTIFISIDNNELDNLKKLCDQIFGEKNFIEIFSWVRTETPANLSKKTKKTVEYILCYEKKRSSQKYKGLRRESKSTNGLMNQTNQRKKLIFPAEVVQTSLENCTLSPGYYGTDNYDIELLEKTEVNNGRFIEEVKLEGKFKWSQQKLEKEIKNGTKIFIKTKALSPSYERNDYGREVPWNLINKRVDVGTYENSLQELKDLFGEKKYDYPKPISLIKYILNFVVKENDIVLDFFSGSGTTGHSVLNLSNNFDKKIKYIQVEMSKYFQKLMLPRIKKRMFSNNWENGIPKSNNKGYSHIFKYQKSEQYEDTLENISFKEKGQMTFAEQYEDYMLNYMLDYETKDSLLDIDKFSEPFSYKIKVVEDKEKKKKNVDLVETFNYLIGLEVNKIKVFNNQDRKYKVIKGNNNNKVLIIWRNTVDLDLEKDRDFIQSEIIGQDKYDKIYINGDNFVPNSILIERTFKNKMFEEGISGGSK